jgi:hypothetical protein
VIPDRLAPQPSPPRSRWGILVLSMAGLAFAGVAKFGGQPRSLPLDEAVRTLVSCQGANERELALGVVASRARELVTILATQARQGNEYAAAHLDNLVEMAKKERER